MASLGPFTSHTRVEVGGAICLTECSQTEEPFSWAVSDLCIINANFSDQSFLFG